MKKRTYKAIKVQNIKLEKLTEQLENKGCIFGIDVAKEDFYAGIGGRDGQISCIIKWKHPFETGSFLELIKGLQKAGQQVEAAMEPSGTYGDALKYQLQQLQVPVFRVDPKRCHDFAMVLDGVPSQHDPKSASMLVYMHARSISEPWSEESEQKRQLKAHVMKRELYADPLERHYGRLESKLAAHWPELPYILDMRGHAIVALLSHYGSPAQVARDAEGAKKFLRKVGHGRLSVDKIKKAVESAKHTYGVPMVEAERETLKQLAEEIEQLRRKVMHHNEILKELSKSCAATMHLANTFGLITAVVLIAFVGDPSEYRCAAAYEKAMGLNLKELRRSRELTQVCLRRLTHFTRGEKKRG